jgi:hypothetical protein
MLAHEFGISTKTLNRRLEKVGLHFPLKLITPNQLEQIYEKLGFPTSMPLSERRMWKSESPPSQSGF